MSGKAKTPVPVRLFWGGDTLWLGPWKVAELIPEWDHGDMNRAPTGWRIVVGGAWRSEGGCELVDALNRAEHVTHGQLAGLGVRRVEFQRQDGTTRLLEEK